MKIRFICAQPAVIYYAWQVEVMLQNFISVGININDVDIVCSVKGSVPEEWSKLANNYPARFFFYNDKRETKHYISSIRPNILKQHFEAYPELKDDAIFYHDCDMVFTKPIDWNKFTVDNKWYGSDTRFYISYEYIISKGEDVLDKMCEIVGIDKQVIKDNELNCIGAQYLMKGIDATFWANVEKDSERLFKEITDLNNEKVQLDRHTMPEGEARQPYHPLQIWCADMWAVLWNGWKLGYETVCHEDLTFAWATSDKKTWDECNIYHNAGATNSNSGIFYKAAYSNKLPYNEQLEIKEDSASYEYWKLIEKAAKTSVLIEHKPEPELLKDSPINKSNRLGIFYSNNNNTSIWNSIYRSLDSIKKAANGEVDIITCMWETMPLNPFNNIQSWYRSQSHLNQLLQIMQCLYYAKDIGKYDYVSFLEHDVLYPEGYFDFPNFERGVILTNMNYGGVNKDGWQKRKYNDEPFHQMTMRMDDAIEHCLAILPNALKTNSGYIENQNLKRVQWLSKNEAIHINHGVHFTSHNSIYDKSDTYKTHPYWGEHSDLIHLFKIED
jgi:hypothetical protein